MKDNKWARLLAYVTGLVNQKLLLQNEYLIAENRIFRAQLPQRLQLTDESGHLKHAAIETKFICVSEAVEIGSLIDGWKVGWCMPDQNCLIWHVMVLRPAVRCRGCCG